MTNPAIIEAAARALELEVYDYVDHEDGMRLARVVLTAVTPLIEAAVLERAAQTVENMLGRRDAYARDNIAAAIRALKEQP